MTPLPRPSCLSPAPAEPVSARRMRIEMGTWVVIEAHGAAAESVQRGIEAAFAAVADVVRCMHPEHPDSDVARISAAPPGTTVPVRPDTLKLLRFAQRLHCLSAGGFDPCLPGAPGRLGDLRLLPGSPPAVSPGAAMQLDLGGIAKGFAVDCAVAALRAAGCSGGIVNAGGDLRVFGAAAETILAKRADGSYRAVTLKEAALAVSDRDAPHAPSGHRGYYRRAGRSAGAARYAAVRAADAMTADALTKCVLVCPAPLSASLLRQLGAENLS